MRTVTFAIEGMHCDGCSQTIKTLLEKEPGVQIANVSFQEREARVMFDPNATSEDWLIATIQKPGFRIVGQR